MLTHLKYLQAHNMSQCSDITFSENIYPIAYICPQYITQLVRKHFIDNAIDGIYSINEAKRKMS
jgi:hypothetical protein